MFSVSSALYLFWFSILSVCGFRGDKVVGDVSNGGKTQSNYYLCINRLIYSLIIYELFLVGPSELCRTTLRSLGGLSAATPSLALAFNWIWRSGRPWRQDNWSALSLILFFSFFFCFFFFCGSSFVLFYIAYICIWIYISIYIYLHLCTRWFLCDFMQMKIFMFCWLRIN